MKKILVVLLILAVAGGAFAQGSWSVNANAAIGATMDFDADPNATFIGESYHDGGGDGNFGAFGFNYNVDGLSAGLSFDTSGAINASMSFYGNNYSFGAAKDLRHLLNGTGNDPWNFWDIALWGKFSFLNNVFDLDIVHRDNWGPTWNSDASVIDVFGDFGKSNGGDIWGNLCCWSGIRGNLKFAGLEFGATLTSMNNMGTGADGWMFYRFTDSNGDNDPQLEFVDDLLKKMIIGLKFAMTPVEFAVQFNLDNYGAYLGARWFIGPVTAGLSFLGIFDDAVDYTEAAFAAGIDWNGGAFGAGLKGGYKYFSDDQFNLIGVNPSFWFNVIPDHMRFELGAGFMFGEDGFSWEFEPAILWNFKGTGAGNWDTGIGIFYKVAKDMDDNTTNLANITFRWSM